MRQLRRHGCHLKREGASHSLWTNPTTGVVEAIPRHADIPDMLARKTGSATLGARALNPPSLRRQRRSANTYSAFPVSGCTMSGLSSDGTRRGLPPPRPVETAMYWVPSTP